MSAPHFFIDQVIPGKTGEYVKLILDEDVLGHMRTLRLKAGETIALIDTPGHAWQMLLSTAPKKRSKSIEGSLTDEYMRERTVDLTLIQGISAPDRMDQTIRQVTELGISRIIPLKSEFSNARLDASAHERKRLRWQKIARSAVEQSNQLYCPTIECPVNLTEALNMLEGYDLLLFFWEKAQNCPLSQAMSECKRITPQSVPAKEQQNCAPVIKTAVFVGPEGGFSDKEAASIMAFGARAVSLGPTILRTETAAVVACALVLDRLGALGVS